MKKKNRIELMLKNRDVMKILFLDDNIIKVSVVRHDLVFYPSSLDRYGFIDAATENVDSNISEDKEEICVKTGSVIVRVNKNSGEISFCDRAGKLLTKSRPFELMEKGYKGSVSLAEKEEIYGFGDQSREYLKQRGRKVEMWIENDNSRKIFKYMVIPFYMSTAGYGLFINTTWRHSVDVGATDNDRISWETTGGDPEIYFFYGPDFKSILGGYTSVTGRPPLLPIWGFGLWFICREVANDMELMHNAQVFRDRGIPCDVLGLEPGWMKVNYDLSVKCEWHPERFMLYPWATSRSFIMALKRMGFHLELWEANDYDLSIEAERSLSGKKLTAESGESKGVENIMPLRPDEYKEEKASEKNEAEESWFEHHRKFIDQGIAFFKQDAYRQTYSHPDRKWGNGMSDEEMHNLYPMLYCKQMYEGFKEHTGRRPLCFNPNGWAGIQRYAASWAGDCGGNDNVLPSSLNLAFGGQSYTTCDMDVTSPESIHFGFLQPLSQINSFAFWLHPWTLGEKLEAVFKYYDKLRYRLLPYLYSLAWQSHSTGVPMLRPMIMEFPEDEQCGGLMKQYMLGGELLVGTFSDEAYLPSGQWIDYWTGQEYAGGNFVKCQIPEGRGGLLFVKVGSIIPLWPEVQYTTQRKIVEITLDIYPGGGSEFTLYEDDGITFGYQDKQYALTAFKCSSGGGNILIDIAKRSGTYDGMPEKRDYTLLVHLPVRPSAVLAGEKTLPEKKKTGDTGLQKDCWSYDPDEHVLQVTLRDKADSDSRVKIENKNKSIKKRE